MCKKSLICILKPSKNTLWAKNSNFHIRIFFKCTFLEPSRGPLQIATMISEGCFQNFFDRKSEPWVVLLIFQKQKKKEKFLKKRFIRFHIYREKCLFALFALFISCCAARETLQDFSAFSFNLMGNLRGGD
jgi:hypothetical protein